MNNLGFLRKSYSDQIKCDQFAIEFITFSVPFAATQTMTTNKLNHRKCTTKGPPQASPRASPPHCQLEIKAILWIAKVLILMFLLGKCLSNNEDTQAFFKSKRLKFFTQRSLIPGTNREENLDHLQLSATWPASLSLVGKKINEEAVFDHIEAYPDTLIAHGLWGMTNEGLTLLYCGHFNDSYQGFKLFYNSEFQSLAHLFKQFWPSLSLGNRYLRYFNTWVRVVYQIALFFHHVTGSKKILSINSSP